MDVIMIAMNPWLEKDSRLNRALDACHKKQIGLAWIPTEGIPANKTAE